jgi:hypothetical protein
MFKSFVACIRAVNIMSINPAIYVFVSGYLLRYIRICWAKDVCDKSVQMIWWNHLYPMFEILVHVYSFKLAACGMFLITVLCSMYNHYFLHVVIHFVHIGYAEDRAGWNSLALKIFVHNILHSPGYPLEQKNLFDNTGCYTKLSRGRT